MHPYYVQQVFNELRTQAQKLQQLEKQLEELQKDVETLKNNKSAAIGPINYHFEQLKIEKLEGTLNIGITPNEGNHLDEAVVNGQTIGSQSQDTEKQALSEKIRPELAAYLQNEVPEQFVRRAKERKANINPQYIQMVTQDLEQQMDGRIEEYLSQLPVVQENRDNIEEVCASIVSQIKRDIDTAVQRHMDLEDQRKAGLV
ncbi:hypothetical protein H1230_15700 [Paenibacillus sp. 19GGS1-52]|uniref:spore germination protein GerPC n=1 Tax=Paenibacillus sp. 19GGS1-52 TaxID=2758563 RepID=UPI001EFB1C04|nr:spore germination protein GerPC [Paenibacillus sp. 19GGS1-52]ULO10082.1 hypothetical protein H1230_15700 [Paenibacillus sp. 19GGS1-52]